MPIYPDPKTAPKDNRTWMVKVSVQNRQVVRRFRGLTARQIELEEAKLLVDLEKNGIKDTTTAPTFSSFCVETYAPWAEANLGRTTWENRTYIIATLVAHFGPTRLDKLTKHQVENFRTARRGAGIANSTINDEVKVLKAVLNHARYLDVPAVVPEVKRLKEIAVRGHAEPWSESQVEALFAGCQKEHPEFLPVLVFLLNTGCRKTEAIRLRWKSIDWTNSTIWIEPSEEWRPKDNEARAVPMSKVLRSWLKRLEARNEEREEPSEYVFVGSRKQGPWKRWPQRLFDESRDAAGLTGGPHKCRHTFASHYLAKGGSLFKLARILGQENEAVTEIYSHMLPGAMAEAAELIHFSPSVGPATAGVLAGETAVATVETCISDCISAPGEASAGESEKPQNPKDSEAFRLERVKRFELSTSTLARLDNTSNGPFKSTSGGFGRLEWLDPAGSSVSILYQRVTLRHPLNRHEVTPHEGGSVRRVAGRMTHRPCLGRFAHRPAPLPIRVAAPKKGGAR